jgi:hypothetical protein
MIDFNLKFKFMIIVSIDFFQGLMSHWQACTDMPVVRCPKYKGVRVSDATSP